MSHLSYNNVPLSRGMLVFQIGTRDNDHVLLRFKVVEVLPNDTVKLIDLQIEPKIITTQFKTVPCKNVHTDPKSLVQGRIDNYTKELEEILPAKISSLKKMVSDIENGIIDYNLMGEELSSEIEI